LYKEDNCFCKIWRWSMVIGCWLIVGCRVLLFIVGHRSLVRIVILLIIVCRLSAIGCSLSVIAVVHDCCWVLPRVVCRESVGNCRSRSSIKIWIVGAQLCVYVVCCFVPYIQYMCKHNILTGSSCSCVIRFIEPGDEDQNNNVIPGCVGSTTRYTPSVSHQWCDLFSSTTAQLYATHRKRE